MEKIINRIRNLLAMSRGTANENEAAAAANKAQQLLADYNLSLSDVEKTDARGKVIEDGDLMTSSSNPWRRDLAAATARLYLCDYYWNHVYLNKTSRKCGYVRGDKHNFIGLAHNVIVAKEMFVYFVDTIERLAKTWRKERKMKTHDEHAFRTSCAARLCSRLWERYDQQTAPPAGLLIKSNVPALYKGIAAEIADYMQEHHSDVRELAPRGRTNSWAGTIEGRKAGDTIGLDVQLEGDAPLAIGSK